MRAVGRHRRDDEKSPSRCRRAGLLVGALLKLVVWILTRDNDC